MAAMALGVSRRLPQIIKLINHIIVLNQLIWGRSHWLENPQTGLRTTGSEKAEQEQENGEEVGGFLRRLFGIPGPDGGTVRWLTCC